MYLIHDVIIFLGQMFSLPRHLIYLGLKTKNFSVLHVWRDKHTSSQSSYNRDIIILKKINIWKPKVHIALSFYKLEVKKKQCNYWSTQWTVFLTLKEEIIQWNEKKDNKNDIAFVDVSVLIIIYMYYFVTYKFLSDFLSFSSFIQ